VKRIVLAFFGTGLGLVALLSFKSHGHPVGAGAALPSATLPGASSSASASSSPRASQSTSAPPNPSSSSARRRTIVGDAIQTQYGVVQIKATVTGSKIADVSYVQLTAYDGRSQQINSYAAPILLQETLSTQSANIDTVSGATYTSEGYIQSLQSALDKAGIK
jgi:uncharacterized protein with FMN-binding domain